MLLPLLLAIGAIKTVLPIRSRIELVQMVFRNGERISYPLDSYPRVDAEDDLTAIGERRSRRLGFILRREYASRLNEPVRAYSANRTSCERSARLVLAELGSAESVVRGDVFLDARLCPDYAKELQRVRDLPEVQKMLSKYSGLYRYIAEKTGMELEDSRPDERLCDLYNLLESQRAMSLSLPEWCPEGVIGLLGEVAALHYNIESYSGTLRRLNGGHLLRRFLERMRAMKPSAGMYLYAGTGDDIAGFARALGKRFPRVPNYGSALILEKHRDVENDRVYVRTMMWTGPTEKLFSVQLRGCVEFCPLDEFAKLVDEVLPADWEVACGSNNSNLLNPQWS